MKIIFKEKEYEIRVKSFQVEILQIHILLHEQKYDFICMYTNNVFNSSIQIMFSILVTKNFTSVLFGSHYAPYLQPSRYMYILKSV